MGKKSVSFLKTPTCDIKKFDLQEAQQTSSRIDTKETTLGHIVVKSLRNIVRVSKFVFDKAVT